MVAVNYAAVCETIEDRPSIEVWPNIRRLGKNRVDTPSFPAETEVPLVIAANLSADEAQQGLQVVEFLVEIYDVHEDRVVQRLNLAEPMSDLSNVTPGPIGYNFLLTPRLVLELPRPTTYVMRIKTWTDHYDFLLSAFAAPSA